jgi:hypothetical protein
MAMEEKDICGPCRACNPNLTDEDCKDCEIKTGKYRNNEL